LQQTLLRAVSSTPVGKQVRLFFLIVKGVSSANSRWTEGRDFNVLQLESVFILGSNEIDGPHHFQCKYSQCTLAKTSFN
jgi:hypothetical protein